MKFDWKEGKKGREIGNKKVALFHCFIGFIHIQNADWLEARRPLGKSEKLWWFRIERHGWVGSHSHSMVHWSMGKQASALVSIPLSHYPILRRVATVGAPWPSNPPMSPLAPCLAFSFLCPEFLRVSTQKEGDCRHRQRVCLPVCSPLFLLCLTFP